MLKMRAFSVSEINQYLKRLLSTDPIINRVIIEGEISNFTRHSSGHAYFTLKDEGSKLNCVMFSQQLSRVERLPKNGDKVHAKGRVSIYERDGRYQLYVDEIEQVGIGALYIKFEALKKQLEKEGLFDQSQKQAIPQYPSKIGVITSPTGAAVRDIISVAQRRSNLSNLLIYPVRVQGELSKDEICEALDYFNQRQDVDVIILSRGGGSIEELWSFNEEVVARQIFASKIPVVSGVGHETDFTISDFVSDLRAPTPSAAAEMTICSKEETAYELRQMMNHMTRVVNRRVVLEKTKIQRHSPEWMAKQCLYKIEKHQKEIAHTKALYEKTVNNRLSLLREQLEAQGEKLHSLSPLNIMSRGYSVVKYNNGQLMTSVKQAKEDDSVEIVLKDGKIQSKIVEITENE